MIVFHPTEKLVYDVEEAMAFLGLPTKSALENLIRLGRLTPLRITKANRFAKAELVAFVERELAESRRLAGASVTPTEGMPHAN